MLLELRATAKTRHPFSFKRVTRARPIPPDAPQNLHQLEPREHAVVDRAGGVDDGRLQTGNDCEGDPRSLLGLSGRV